MKKLVTVLTVALFVTILIPVTAFAHGHSGTRRATSNIATRYAVCTVDDCNLTYSHQHDETWYCGHTLNDGHEYHEICSVISCTLTAVHEHDGVLCFPHAVNDGHSYHLSGHGGRHH
jgi:hypothetical protein